MTNQTVYPYGTEGSLPSSIGIINDITTGGADKALSAEMGKQIGDVLYEDVYEVKNLSIYTLQSYSLGASDWRSTGKHRAIPVTPGDVYRITVYSTEVSGAFYGFFTNSYTVPTSASSPRPYVQGTDRQWVGISDEDFQEQGYVNKSVEITVPATTAYLIICPKDGLQYNTTWTVERKTTRMALVTKSSIVNNTTDGGTDVPLSAEVGKHLASEMNKVFVSTDVEIPSATVNWMINSQNKWQNSGQHKAVAVIPGSKIRLRSVNSQQPGNFYAWLTSAYTVPPTAGDSAPYAGGYTERNYSYDEHGWYEWIVPADAAWLYIVVKNGDGYTSDWIVQTISAISTTEAFEQYVWPQGDEYAKHEYSGPLVKIQEKHKVAASQVTTVTSQSFQGGACYGDYLFMFTENNTTCWVYNLLTGTLLQTINIPSEERGFVSQCHCNTVNFGTEKYDDDDQFPLIYVSTGYASGGYSGALVYRIVVNTESDVTTYSLTLVQTVRIPSNWSEFIVGKDGDCYIKTEDNGIVYYRMRMPKLSQGDVTLDFVNALSVCHLTPQPSWYNGSRNQGHIYHNGKIYLVSGVPTSETSLFIVINLSTGEREVEIDLYNTLGLHSEPEALFIWDGRFCIAFRSNANVYALYFE